MRRTRNSRVESVRSLSRRLRASSQTAHEAERQRIFVKLADHCERRIAESGNPIEENNIIETHRE